MTKEIATQDFFAGKLPDLKKATPATLELSGEYWSPDQIGEQRRAFFNELRQEISIKPDTGESIDLLVAYFVWEDAKGNMKVFRNASRRLTGVLENINLQKGTPVEITYMGKVKNKNNSFMSDNWSIRPLIIDIEEEQPTAVPTAKAAKKRGTAI